VIEWFAAKYCEGERVINLLFFLLGEEVTFLETVFEILREVLKGIVSEVVKLGIHSRF
jgi:hypothetical protein